MSFKKTWERANRVRARRESETAGGWRQVCKWVGTRCTGAVMVWWVFASEAKDNQRRQMQRADFSTTDSSCFSNDRCTDGRSFSGIPSVTTTRLRYEQQANWSTLTVYTFCEQKFVTAAKMWEQTTYPGQKNMYMCVHSHCRDRLQFRMSATWLAKEA